MNSNVFVLNDVPYCCKSLLVSVVVSTLAFRSVTLSFLLISDKWAADDARHFCFLVRSGVFFFAAYQTVTLFITSDKHSEKVTDVTKVHYRWDIATRTPRWSNIVPQRYIQVQLGHIKCDYIYIFIYKKNIQQCWSTYFLHSVSHSDVVEQWRRHFARHLIVPWDETPTVYPHRKLFSEE